MKWWILFFVSLNSYFQLNSTKLNVTIFLFSFLSKYIILCIHTRLENIFTTLNVCICLSLCLCLCLCVCVTENDWKRFGVGIQNTYPSIYLSIQTILVPAEASLLLVPPFISSPDRSFFSFFYNFRFSFRSQ